MLFAGLSMGRISVSGRSNEVEELLEKSRDKRQTRQGIVYRSIDELPKKDRDLFVETVCAASSAQIPLRSLTRVLKKRFELPGSFQTIERYIRDEGLWR
jgi:hypothetical protein